MSSYQKQNLLDQLHQYLSSTEAMKAVMNSPGLDKRGGKMLTFDGTKSIYSNQNGFKNGVKAKNDWKKRGQKEKGKANNGQSNNKSPGQSKSNQVFINHVTFSPYSQFLNRLSFRTTLRRLGVGFTNNAPIILRTIVSSIKLVLPIKGISM